jgi:hypothetical protein
MYIDINTLFTFEVSKSDDQSILAAIVLYIILKNFSLNLLSKMFVLTEIIDCIFLLFSKILSPVLPISPLYYTKDNVTFYLPRPFHFRSYQSNRLLRRSDLHSKNF